MKQYSEAFVGFDTAKKKHAVAIADVGRGRDPRRGSHSGPTRRSRWLSGGLPIDDPRWREPAADMAKTPTGRMGPLP
jgi:hypothetical protein